MPVWPVRDQQQRVGLESTRNLGTLLSDSVDPSVDPGLLTSRS